jgi:hypothetical protein
MLAFGKRQGVLYLFDDLMHDAMDMVDLLIVALVTDQSDALVVQPVTESTMTRVELR